MSTGTRCAATGRLVLTDQAAARHAGSRNQIAPGSHVYDECRWCGGWHSWRFLDAPGDEVTA